MPLSASLSKTPNAEEPRGKPRTSGGELPSIMDLLELERGRLRPLAVDFPGASEISGLSRSALYQAAGRGHLPVRKWGARAIIMVDDLEEYLKSLPLGSYNAPTRG